MDSQQSVFLMWTVCYKFHACKDTIRFQVPMDDILGVKVAVRNKVKSWC